MLRSAIATNGGIDILADVREDKLSMRAITGARFCLEV